MAGQALPERLRDDPGQRVQQLKRRGTRLLAGGLLAIASCCTALWRLEAEASMKGEILSTAEVVGLAWLDAPPGPHLLVMHHEKAGGDTVLALFGGAKGSWKQVKAIKNSDRAIHALDAALEGDKVLFVSEVNRGAPFQLSRCAWDALVDPKVKDVPFESAGAVELDAEHAPKVKLSPSQLWNTLDLAPQQWLFNPSLVRGAPGPTLQANTADGQALSVAADKQALRPDAFAPQALGSGLTAFRRLAEQPVAPFYLLSRWSGPDRPLPGELIATGADGAEENLSRTLSLGPVVAHALAAGKDGAPWLFAAIDAPVGTELVALTKAGGKWAVAKRLTVDAEVESLAALARDVGWELALVARTKKGRAVLVQPL